MSNDRINVLYHLTCHSGEDPAAKARDIAWEQTVELPEACVPEAVAEAAVGRPGEPEALGGGRWAVRIDYPADLAGDDLGQLLNLVFGNVSMKAGIRVAALELPAGLLDRLEGPGLGVDGLRRLCGAGERRPLLCAALKPVGLGLAGLVERCRELALAGVDLIKDDHSLADQPPAPFAERVPRCAEAVGEANRETGGSTLYFPHLAGRRSDLEDRLARVHAAGCRGVMLSPLLVGLETVRHLAAAGDLALLGHPSLAGAYFAPDHGIAPEVLLGTVFRLAGCDGVIYPNAGGRFVLDRPACEAINRRLLEPLGTLRPAFPVPGGGLDRRRVPEWSERYGPDVVFLIGGSLFLEPDLRRAAADLVRALRSG